MSPVKQRKLPSKSDLMALWGIIVIITHVWAFIMFFQQVPALLLKASLPQLLFVLAYVLTVALLESVVLLIVILAILQLTGLFIPVYQYQQAFLGLGTGIMVVLLGWAYFVQEQSFIKATYFAYLIFLLPLVVLLLYKMSGVSTGLGRIVKRLQILSFAYFAIDVLTIFILAIHLLSPSL
jgi:hypothetical protein